MQFPDDKKYTSKIGETRRTKKGDKSWMVQFPLAASGP